MNDMRQLTFTGKHHQQGLSMIEIMVAMLILAVGLLGMASMQVRAVQDTSNSSYRGVALYYANDMADRMRANSEGVDNGDYGDGTGGSAKANCLNTTGCSSADMATNDRFEWQANLARSLPAGQGSIALNGSVYTVRVQWTDRVEQGTTSIATSSIDLSFEP
ncbi:hypothetical protein A3762_11320 [Oleiphilus sp. HI0125]|nr:hypothetical protein A3762_11320 [Oleiphilus sp. HI0125]